MNPVVGFMQLIMVGGVLFVLYMIVYTYLALSRPPRQSYASAIARKLPSDPSELEEPLVFEEKALLLGTGTELPYWVVQGRASNGPRVFMTHGWGSSRLGGLKRIGPMVEHAREIVLWDLPGHGEHAGHARMGVDDHHLLAQLVESFVDWDSVPVVCYGWSMGAGVTLAFAKDYQDKFDIKGLLCEAPYIHAMTPARNVIRLKGFPYRLNLRPAMALLGMKLGTGIAWNGFARDVMARHCQSPVLVIHGETDPVCPISDGEQIAASAPHGKLVRIQHGGHNNLWAEPSLIVEMNAAINQFVKHLSC